MSSILLHNNDIGVTLTLTVEEDGSALDISSATSLTFYLRSPNGTVESKTASFDSDGTDGKLKYNTVDGDIDSVGRWELQAGFQLGTWVGRTRPVEFDVGPAFS